MLLRIPYSELKADGVKGVYASKPTTFYLRVEVTESNVEEAVSRFGASRSVVAFDYVGSWEALPTLSTSKPLLVTRSFDTLDTEVDLALNALSGRAHLVCQLPETFSDMRLVYDYSQRYQNVRFCGGHFLHLGGCRLGCVLPHEIPRKFPESKMPIVTSGCASVAPTITTASVLDIEFFNLASSKAPKEPKASGGKAAPVKAKRALSALLTLPELPNVNGLENF